MQSNHRAKVCLASLLLIGTIASAQSTSPPVCNGKPLSMEAQFASMPSKCDVMSPACERISKSPEDLIFAGRVIKLTNAPAQMLLDGVCTATTVQTVTLLVKETFSGSPTQIVTLHAGYINGYWFRPKEADLVYARKFPDGSALVSGCHTKPIDSSNPQFNEDLAYLRSRDKLPPTGNVLGNTWVVPPPAVNDEAIAVGFGGQSLSISGPVSIRVKTSMAGEFRLDNLPPGKYTIHIDSALQVEPAREQQIEILPKGCAQVIFYIESEADYKRITSSMLRSRVKK